MPTLRASLSALLVLFCVLPAAFAGAAPSTQSRDEYTIAPAPGWILAGRPELQPSGTREATNGREYLAIDRQIRVDARGQDTYSDFAEYIVSESGVEQASTVKIEFDPHTERISLHKLKVRRGDAEFDQIESARFTVLRRESGLEDGLLDGELTLSIVLEDIRAGDIIEYSYSRHYLDPVLGPRLAESFVTQWSEPVKWSRLRLLAPADRAIDVTYSVSETMPTVHSSAGMKNTVWLWRDLPAIVAESQQPSWNRQYPRIRMSEWHAWADVVDWAVDLYRPAALSPEMRSLIEQWTAATPSSAERIILALRFVQDQVRYTGIEIGPGAFQPTDPARVLQRRFGDCKDKVMLLVTLLQAMKIDARPALVNTSLQHVILDTSPDPAIFDHAIIAIRHEGSRYWFDPTVAGQGGSLESTVQSNYGAALVLMPGIDKPEVMVKPKLAEPATEVSETFDLRAGMLAKGTLIVKTTYRGGEADWIRQDLRSSTSEKTGRGYLDYYRGWYPTIKSLAPPKFSDNREENRIDVLESYEFTPAFETKDNGSLRFDINPYIVRTNVAAPTLIQRTTPLAVRFPLNVRYSVDVSLPTRWDVKSDSVAIDDPAFTYRSTIQYSGRRFTARYEFRTLSDSVAAERSLQYARNLERVRDDASYWFTHSGATRLPTAQTINIVVVLSAALGMIMGVLLVRRLQGYKPPSSREIAPDSPTGIRGWLLLPALQTCIMPVAFAMALYSYWPYLNISAWDETTDGATVLGGQLIRLGYFTLICSCCALMIGSTYSAFLLFARRRTFPRAYILFSWLAIGWSVLNHLIVLNLPDAGAETLRTTARMTGDVFSAALWTVYMLKSRRVAATFVRAAAESRPDRRSASVTESPVVSP